MGKQLTELEQATADLRAAQKTHTTKQAALARAYDAEQAAAAAVAQARQVVQDVLEKEAREAAAATKAAVGIQQQPARRPARPARPAGQQQLTDGERQVEHVLRNVGSQVTA